MKYDVLNVCVQRASYFVLCVLFYIFVRFYRKARASVNWGGILQCSENSSHVNPKIPICWQFRCLLDKIKNYKIQYIDKNVISKLKPLKHLIMNFAGTLNKWYQRTYLYQRPNFKALWRTGTGNKYISKWSKSLYILYQLGFWCDNCYRPLCSDSKSISVQSFDHLHVI